MNILDEIKSVILKDKREIHLNDEDELSLSILSDGKTIFEYLIDYPHAGYGGGSLYLSPDELYLLFSYYSGQSEEAFTLFEIGGDLEIVYGSDYIFGEAASYGFAQNENLLIQCLPNSCTLWDWKDYMEQGFAEKDEDGNLFLILDILMY